MPDPAIGTGQAAVLSASRLNNFDVLRLLGASLVLVDHSYALTGTDESALGGLGVGRIGLLIFFGISGFLIVQSWMSDPDLKRFAVKRALRIWPALGVVLLLTAFVLGPIATNLSVVDYLTRLDTWRYTIDNLLMIRMDFDLAGVFTNVPYPHGVNGSLWTLPTEARAYVIIALLGVAGLFRRRIVVTVCLLLIAACASAWESTSPVLGNSGLLRTFCVGAVLCIWRDRVPWRWSIATVLIVLWAVLAWTTPADWVAASIACPYITIMLAYRTSSRWRRLTRPGDVSYGLYLYAFPVQQAIAALWSGATPLGMIAISGCVTYGLAYASWRLVEKPALDLKPRRAPRDAADPVALVATPATP